MSKESPLRAGARVGQFVVIEEIGFGATSVVYEAEHRTLRNRVAIKVLRAQTEMDHELRRRFEREMHLLANVASVHVPHVYDVGELPNGLPYIVMERLSGSTLADWLCAHRKLDLPLAVEIAAQVCSALTALHEANALHRDVKPENLVLHRDPAGAYIVKLVDFGICKPREDDGPPLTLRGTVVGTPEYMSPEQVQGLELDERTDVYSTGVVLYELLAGRTPFQGRDIGNLGRSILVEDPPRLSDLCPECPPALETIVMRAMARSTKARYESTAALRRELERFADERGLRRSPRVWNMLPAEGPSQVVELTHRKQVDTAITNKLPLERRSVMAAAFAGVAVVAGLIGGAYYAFQPRATAVAAIEPPRLMAETPLPIAAEPEPPIAPSLAIVAPEPAQAPAVEEPVAADEELVAAMVEAPAEPAVEEPAVEERRARRSRRARRVEREESSSTTTTIAIAPMAPMAPAAPTITAGELLAQAGSPPPPDYVPEPAQSPPPSSDIPSSPYDANLPNNPFGQ
jgi:tRNA A-37 threonylcarbamoyl transferase component Bud32